MSNLTDTLDNAWGTQYVISDENTRRSYFNGVIPSAHEIHTLQDLVKSDTRGNFLLQHVVHSGSCANLYATKEAAQLGEDETEVVYATGTYVSGTIDKKYSTSIFELKTPHLRIKEKNAATEQVQSRVVPLAYHIDPEAFDESYSLIQYENDCLEELHYRALASRLDGKRIGVLFLELILVGTGAVLSDRFLAKLGLVCKVHDIYIVVDEIFTGGRTTPNAMLLTEETPQEFRTRVSHVTLGKWLLKGLVLVTPRIQEVLRKKEDNSDISIRGTSIQIPLKETIYLYNAQMAKRGTMNQRQEDVLEHLKLYEDDYWGKGLMIFGNFMCTGGIRRGLHNRLAPMLELDRNFERLSNLKVKKIHKKNGKAKMNKEIVDAILTWKTMPDYSHPQKYYNYIFCKTICTFDEKAGFAFETECAVKMKQLQKSYHLYDINGENIQDLDSKSKKKKKSIKIIFITGIACPKLLHMNIFLNAGRVKCKEVKRSELYTGFLARKYCVCIY